MKPALTLLCLLLLLASTISSSQNPDSFFIPVPGSTGERSFFRLGDNVLTITKLTKPRERNFVLVSLHNNEVSAIDAARDFVNKNGGQLICLENDENHNIDFEFLNSRYSIDPARIFTQKGRTNILKNGPYKNALSVEVQKFADYVSEIIPHNKHVVGIHSYDEGEVTINNYRNLKSARKTKSLHHNPGINENNFFITADTRVFNELKERNQNVVLQNQAVTNDDGSLGIMIAKNRRIYVDVVAGSNQGEEQKNMIGILSEILEL
jgi:hypothetical protein